MLRVASPSVVRPIESLFDGGSVAGLSDRQLIERFTTRRDPTGEAAFAGLVVRHAPTVLEVCQQLLGDRHDAEDAFQAVFLVLARKARWIRDPELLSNWLYGVALRTARKARVRLASRRTREKEISASRPDAGSGVPAVEPVVAREQAEALHDEIGRLPAALRLPVVLWFLATAFLLLGVVATGAGYVDPAPARLAEKHELHQITAQPEIANPEPAPGRMLIVGRVLNAAGTPVPNAAVTFYASLKWSGRGDGLAQISPSALGDAGSDASGGFRLDAPRTASSRHYQVGAVAVAPGYGAGWVQLDPDAGQPAADITLRPEQVIQGRLFDVQGRPAQGVDVSVESMGTIVAGNQDMTLGESEGPYFFRVQPGDLSAWPPPSKSDADGRFTIRGAGRNIRVGLVIDDPRFARQRTHVDTDGSSETKNVTMAVEPARIITGRVTYAGTGKPAPHAVVGISIQGDDGSSAWAGDIETDAHGRFRANPGSGHRYLFSAFPPEREPYLNVQKNLEWPRGAIEHSLDLVLPRGILVRGRVTEEGSGKPIAGARVGYLSNPDRDPQTGAWNTRAATASDGSFQLGVMPARGYLSILGPGEDYVLQEIGQRMALTGQPGGRRIYAHAFHKLDLKSGSPSQEVAITLRPSTTVKGHVVGPDGQPVRNALVISRVILQPTWIAWLFWTAAYRDAVRDGCFAVHGLAPDTEVPVYFLDARHNLGATAFLSGRSAAGGAVTVRLQPCGAARARLVDSAGKPVPRSRDTYGSHMTMMVVSPGPHRLSQDKTGADRLAADQDFVARFDPIHYRKGLVSDDQGQLSLPALIPGAVYRIYDNTKGDDSEPQLRKEFTVKPAETVDLGDIRIEKPEE